jgi:serine/arginine repetitive matrix protein 1
MKDLWKLLISAQNSPSGIPDEIIKEKEEDLIKQVENKTEKIKFLEKMIGEKKIDPEERKEKKNSSERTSKRKEKKHKRSRSRSYSPRSRSRSRKRRHKKHNY